MSDLQVARLSNLMRSGFLLGRGEGPVAPEISDELRGVVVVEGERAEHRYLAGELLWEAYQTEGPDAVNLSWIALVNPRDSGSLVSIESIIISGNGAQDAEVRIGFPGTSGPREIDGRPRDSRIGDNLSAAFITSGVGVTGGSRLGNRPNSHREVYFTQYVLAPDSALYVVNTVANNSIVGSFAWKERAIERSERAK